MWETWVQSLDWDDLLEKGKATHSSILAWGIPALCTVCGIDCTWDLPSKSTGVGCHCLLRFWPQSFLIVDFVCDHWPVAHSAPENFNHSSPPTISPLFHMPKGMLWLELKVTKSLTWLSDFHFHFQVGQSRQDSLKQSEQWILPAYSACLAARKLVRGRELTFFYSLLWK